MASMAQGVAELKMPRPDAASRCQATFAIDLQIFRLKTVRDFHFGILRNILARPNMEKESNMNRKDMERYRGYLRMQVRFVLTLLAFFSDWKWVCRKSATMDFGCFFMFLIVCIRLLRYKKGGCMGLHYLFMALYEMRAVHPLFLPLDVNGLFSCVLPKAKHWQQLPCNFDANCTIYLIIYIYNI